MESAKTQIALQQLPTGTRLVVRPKLNWRFAAVSKAIEDKVVLTVCSPTGRTYRLRKAVDSDITYEGSIPILTTEYPEHWRDNFSPYDARW